MLFKNFIAVFLDFFFQNSFNFFGFHIVIYAPFFFSVYEGDGHKEEGNGMKKDWSRYDNKCSYANQRNGTDRKGK